MRPMTAPMNEVRSGQPPVTAHVLHAFEQVGESVARAGADPSRLGRLAGHERQTLGDGEDADDGGDDVHAVPQEDLIEREALHAGLRLGADERQHQAQRADQDALAQVVAADGADEREAEERQEEVLGRAEGEHDGADDRESAPPGTPRRARRQRPTPRGSPRARGRLPRVGSSGSRRRPWRHRARCRGCQAGSTESIRRCAPPSASRPGTRIRAAFPSRRRAEWRARFRACPRGPARRRTPCPWPPPPASAARATDRRSASPGCSGSGPCRCRR